MKPEFYLKALISALLLFGIGYTQAQVTIGSSNPPVNGSILDLKQENQTGANSKKGLGLPRVSLEGISRLDPCVKTADLQPGDNEEHIGLIVYNTKLDMTEGLCPGLYVWDGDKWIRLQGECSNPLDPQLLNSPNSYIVKPGTTSVEIPIGKPYMVWGSRTDLPELNWSHKITLNLL